MKIGFFDSGIGGITVLKQAVEVYPHAHYLYFADQENVPYGTKTTREIRKLVSKAVKFLDKKNIELLVIACNTATSVTIKELREKYDFPIIGMEPAIKPAIEIADLNRILICATKLTLKADKLNDLITDLNANDRVDMLSLQKLVKFAERYDFTSKKLDLYLDRKLSDFDWSKYNSIVLGCTHFLYYKTAIRKRIPNHVKLIDGNTGTVRRMINLLPHGETEQELKLSLYLSKKKVDSLLIQKYFNLLEDKR